METLKQGRAFEVAEYLYKGRKLLVIFSEWTAAIYEIKGDMYIWHSYLFEQGSKTAEQGKEDFERDIERIFQELAKDEYEYRGKVSESPYLQFLLDHSWLFLNK